MKRLIFSNLIAAALALATLGAASAAHARSDVSFFVGVQAPGYYTQPAPVYVQPRPVYVQPELVYTQPQPFYSQPQPVYTQQPVYGTPVYYVDEHARRRAEWRRREWLRHHHHHERGFDRDDRGWD